MTAHNMQVLVYWRLQARREEEVEQQAAGPRAVHVRILPAGVGRPTQHNIHIIYISTILNIYTWQVRGVSLHRVPRHGAPLLQVCDST